MNIPVNGCIDADAGCGDVVNTLFLKDVLEKRGFQLVPDIIQNDIQAESDRAFLKRDGLFLCPGTLIGADVVLLEHFVQHVILSFLAQTVLLPSFSAGVFLINGLYRLGPFDGTYNKSRFNQVEIFGVFVEKSTALRF